MLRRTSLFLIALALLVFLPASLAEAGPLGKAANAARKQLKSDIKAAEKTYSGVASNLTGQVNRGVADPDGTSRAFGNATATFGHEVMRAAWDAEETFADAVVDEMIDSGDNDLPGGLAGDGGDYDKFVAGVQKEVDKARKRTLSRMRKFAKAMGKKGGPRVRTRTTLFAWSFIPRQAPTFDGLVNPAEVPIRVMGAMATRIEAGVIVTIFGVGDFLYSNQFDLRIEGSLQRAVGNFLADGGVDVSVNDTFVVTTQVGDAFRGDGVDEGNRALKLGVEPDDGSGPSGVQPQRIIQAGVISIP